MLHQATCQPPTDGKPGYEFCAGQHFTPKITWWEQSSAFFSFLSRCQYMLRQGSPAVDLLVYYPWLGFPTTLAADPDHREFLFNGRLDDLEPEVPLHALLQLGLALGISEIDPRAGAPLTPVRHSGGAPLLLQNAVADLLAAEHGHGHAAARIDAAHVDLGIAYAKTDELEKAEASLTHALELQPRHPIAWNELGLVQRRLGKLGDARASYEKSLAAAPGFHFARLNLAVLCDLYLADAACALDNYVMYQQAVPDDKQVAAWIASARTRAGKEAK